MMWASTSTSLRWHALPPLWVVVLVILPLVVFGVRFFYRREAGRVGRRLRITMGLLRIAAILLVLMALFGPYAEAIEGERFKRHLILCVDTSSSMGVRDLYERNPEAAEKIRQAAGFASAAELPRRSRLEIVKGLLGRDRSYVERLAADFRLHLYRFADATTGLFEPREEETTATAAERFLRELGPQMRPDGPVTRIGAAIQDLVRAFDAKNEPVAGILLFTDGKHTGGAPDPVVEARRAAEGTREGIPVFPVAIGDPAAATNIAVNRIDAPEVALAGDDVFFTATVTARGLRDEIARLEAAVLDANGNVDQVLPIEAEPFQLPGDDDPPTKVSFRHTFPEPGRYNLRIGVPPLSGEAVVGDNYKTHFLRVKELKVRVLLVANMPNYTYRFLTPAIFRAEDTIEAHVLLLSAEPEWPQESSPNTIPIQRWPKEKRELAAYDVIVLMDVDLKDPRIARDEVEFQEIVSHLESWVKSGGGLVLQAGRQQNIPNLFDAATLRALLPVIPYHGMGEHRLLQMAELGKRKRHKLTLAGASHPIMRILQDPERVREFWETEDYATDYFWYAPVARAKSSTTVLTVRRDEREEIPLEDPHPIIALQDYGVGKVLWLGTDELWRLRREQENLYYWRFWSGVIRHLATYRLLSGNKRIKIWVDRGDGHYQVGDSVQIEAKYLDENFEPVAPLEGDETTLKKTLKLRTPEGAEEEITLHAVMSDPPEGLFRTRIVAGRPGTYSLVAEPQASSEEVAETTFVVEDTTIEQKDPLLDMTTLKRIALASKGEVLQPWEFRELLDNPKVPSTSIVRSGEPRRTDLWDRAWVLWVIVGLLAVEWILRRTNLLL